MDNIYGHHEHRYCEPVAEMLADDVNFARFFLQKANVDGWDMDFRCLKNEQAVLRASGRYWWKNVYCSESRCVCPNLRGREVDIVAIFERFDGARIGMHIECKHPTDRFSTGQAAHYRERLACWTKPERGPRTIPKHEQAVAVLICDRSNKHTESDLAQFDAVIFFDEITKHIKPYPMPEL